jgi:ABC-type antimicrobial peptide transport system permease subunit
VVRLVLGRIVLLVGCGIVAGLAGAAWVSQFIATLLHGYAPGDPVTLIGSAATLALVGTFAGWLPAYNASRADPSRALRGG